MKNTRVLSEKQRIVAVHEKENERAKDQAKAQLESITEMVKALIDAQDLAGNNASSPYQNDLEKAEQVIHEDPLSVEVRSGWFVPGSLPETIEEFNILLCSGGPAVRIVGTISDYQPESARLEYQDWGTPWTEYRPSSDEEDTVLAYCRCFYFRD